MAQGGTRRLGAYPAVLAPVSQARSLYGEEVVHERHRHRFEFNPEYLEDFGSHGMLASGRSPDGKLVEIVELQDHPWYVGVQFHPEFTSRPLRPHPLFQGFLTARLS